MGAHVEGKANVAPLEYWSSKREPTDIYISANSRILPRG